MRYICPVCGFNDLEDPPAHYNICDCCGTEFGNDDKAATVAELGERWLNAGALWFSSFYPKPDGWSAIAQLEAAGLRLPNLLPDLVGAA